MLKKNRGMSLGGKIALFVLLVVLSLYIAALLALLSCAIACSGQSALAVLFGTATIGGLVAGLVLIGVKMFKKKPEQTTT